MGQLGKSSISLHAMDTVELRDLYFNGGKLLYSTSLSRFRKCPLTLHPPSLSLLPLFALMPFHPAWMTAVRRLHQVTKFDRERERERERCREGRGRAEKPNYTDGQMNGSAAGRGRTAVVRLSNCCFHKYNWLPHANPDTYSAHFRALT